MTFEVGKDYKTIGGWKARVIWTKPEVVYCIHKPGEEDESYITAHLPSGIAAHMFEVAAAPSYGQHPATLVSEWKDEEDDNNV